MGIILSSDRDLRIFCFLWKFKVATTRALVERYFHKTAQTSDSGYKRLRQLQAEGYIGGRWSSTERKHCWQLSEKGYKLLKKCLLPPLRAKYFLPEHVGHDLFAAAILVGPRLRKCPEHRQIVSEVELKSYEIEDLPCEVTKDFSHTPDGYWVLREHNQTEVVALEVELNPKNKGRYVDVALYYSSCDNVKIILWVVKNDWIANQILRTVSEYAPNSLDKHCFALAQDVLTSGWQAKFLSGSAKGKTFSDVLNSKSAVVSDANPNGIQEASEGLPPSDKLVFLDCQKSSKVTSSSLYYQVGDFT